MRVFRVTIAEHGDLGRPCWVGTPGEEKKCPERGRWHIQVALDGPSARGVVAVSPMVQQAYGCDAHVESLIGYMRRKALAS